MCAKDVDALDHARDRAAEWADVVEFRLDCLDPSELPHAMARIESLSGPVILTLRPSEQGGYRHLTRTERHDFWTTRAVRGDAVWWDVESDLVREVSPDWSRTIVSHHDFSGVPADLNEIYERLAQTPARIVKIAVRAKDVVDCIPVFQLIERARNEQREIIAIAMGNAGIATRILGPARGSFLTYASLDHDKATAPGQVNARNLRSLYQIDAIDDETSICGLVGQPTLHSVSPHMHNAAFAHEGVNGVYLPFETGDVGSFLKGMVHPRSRELSWNLRGLSITAPHKQRVMEFLDWVDPEAKQIAAVNTVVVEHDRLLGYNTDAAGFIEPLRRRLGQLRDKQVAIIGAGGAARAAVWALVREQARVTLFVRDVSKAARLFDVPCRPLSSASFGEFDVVVNTTPLGSGDHTGQTPASASQLRGAGWVYDLVYNPRETKLLSEAREAGCQTLGGLEMLVAQARIQFELWTGKTPAWSIMYDAANHQLPIGS